MQGETSIAVEMVQNRPWMYEDVGGASDNIYEPIMINTVSFSAKNDSQISCKYSDFGHPFRTGNRMMCYEKIHSLLLECFIAFLRCIALIRGASDGTKHPLMVNIISCLPKNYSQFLCKKSDFGHPLSTRNWRLCCKERHPLLLKWFKTVLGCMRMLEGLQTTYTSPL